MTGVPIPLTVVGGYLGSGKTTLINHLLRQSGGRSLTVLVNDFGDIDIDASLIRSVHGDTISLANGCICCAVGDRLVSTLMEIGRRSAPPDHLVIETSGIADPARVAQIGMAGRRFALHGVMVLVDPLEIRTRWSDPYIGETVRRQLASADLLVLNKTDLLGAGDLRDVRTWLAEHAPETPVFDCVQAEVPIDLVLSQQDTRAGPSEELSFEPEQEHLHGLDSRTIVLPGPIERARLRRMVEALPDGVLRAKGIVACTDDPHRPCLVDRVGTRVTLRPCSAEADTLNVGRIVLIGREDAIRTINVDAWTNTD